MESYNKQFLSIFIPLMLIVIAVTFVQAQTEPTYKDLGTFSVKSTQTLELKAVASDYDDGDILQFSLIDAPSWVTISESIVIDVVPEGFAVGYETVITASPPDGVIGEHEIKIMVSDGSVDNCCDYGIVTVNVIQINHPPILGDVELQG